MIVSHLSACHTSHVTRHTSHVTRHTSHVTRHTSQVTQIRSTQISTHLVVLPVLPEQAFILHILTGLRAGWRIIFSGMALQYILHELFDANRNFGREKALEDLKEIGVRDVTKSLSHMQLHIPLL